MQDELTELFELFLKKYLDSEVVCLINNYPNVKSLNINFSDIDRYNVELSHQLIESPDMILTALRTALTNRCHNNDIQPRIVNNPYKVKIRDVRHEHVGKMASFDGLVLKTTEVRPRFTTAAFQCPFCGHITQMEQTSPKRLIEPRSCEECGKKVAKFILLPEASKYTDSQKIRIQESLEELRGGDVPATKDVEIDGDLTGIVSPGDRVVVNGILRSEIKISSGTKTPVFDVYIEANSVELLEKVFDEIKISDEDEKKILALSEDPALFGKLVANIAPSIYGLREIKEALMLQLFSGVARSLPDGTRKRGDIHILLVGDPSLGKSALISSVVDLAPRGLFTSGGSSSAAGLTCAAVKDEFSGDGWSLEAGALILADRGLCACIAEGQNVITPTGLTPIENMKPGDMVMSHSNGGPIIQTVKRVIAQGIRKTIVLHLYDGSRIECTSDHKILTSEGWKEAGDVEIGNFFVVPANYGEITIKDKDEYEKGFLHGFGLSDMYLNEKSPKNSLWFTASLKNNERTEYVQTLLKRQYGVIVGSKVRAPVDRVIEGREAHFSKSTLNWFSSKDLKRTLMSLFVNNELPSSTIDFKIGFLAGVLSTDCSISHKKGRYGYKHEIDITIGRRKYSNKWLCNKMSLINSIFYELGIMSTIRKRKIVISSLYSYNRIVAIFSPLLVGKKKEQLYKVTPIRNISSYDCYLNDEYAQWFKRIKFKTSTTVKMGLHSRIYGAQKKGVVTTYLMETLKPYWVEITDEPFKDYKKTYILNRVLNLEIGRERRVYDLTINGEHNFLVERCTVSNCDEFDKMSKQDRGALHEAMEQQRVSVAKAGIVATLQSRCALLAAANPVTGRFDIYEPIAKQINMSPTLLSRFDLIFILRDAIDEENDTRLATFVLNTHKEEDDITQSDSYIEHTLLRKYIAYSRRVTPKMTDAALNKFKNFYVSMRREGKREDAAIPITVRQLESLIRLGEASARTRLSEEVTEVDADRVLALFQFCMETVYVDPESGKLDVDWVVAGTTKTKRDRATIIKMALRKLENLYGLDIPMIEVLTAVREEGVEIDKAEEILEAMKRDGILFSPGKGVVRFIR